MRTYIRLLILFTLTTALTACQAYEVKRADAALTGFEGGPENPGDPDNPFDPEDPGDPEVPLDDDEIPADDDTTVPDDDEGESSSSSVASNDNDPEDDDSVADDDEVPVDDDVPADDSEDDDTTVPDDDEGESSSSSVVSNDNDPEDDDDTSPPDDGVVTDSCGKKSDVNPADYAQLPLSLPDSCLAGFEANSPLPGKNIELRSLDLLGSQERILEFEYASYLAPSSVRITGRLLNGETYTLFESCNVRTDDRPSGQKHDRAEEEHIRNYRLRLRSGTIMIKFEAVKQTPFYIRLLGLCDFDLVALNATANRRLNCVNSRN